MKRWVYKTDVNSIRSGWVVKKCVSDNMYPVRTPHNHTHKHTRFHYGFSFPLIDWFLLSLSVSLPLALSLFSLSLGLYEVRLVGEVGSGCVLFHQAGSRRSRSGSEEAILKITFPLDCLSASPQAMHFKKVYDIVLRWVCVCSGRPRAL
jgi:hypothetical protein